MPRSEILTLTRALIALGLGGALAACEPADLMAGGGGGVGGKLAFVRDGALVLSDDAAAGEQVLTDSETSAQPAFSSNGQELVFGFHEAGGTDDAIDRIALTGLSQSTLAAPPAGTSYGSPDYSADDASVVFEAVTGADSVLMQVALDGGTPETLAGSEGLRQPVTLDAARVLALRDGQLVTFEVSTGVVTELASPPAPAPPSPPTAAGSPTSRTALRTGSPCARRPTPTAPPRCWWRWRWATPPGRPFRPRATWWRSTPAAPARSCMPATPTAPACRHCCSRAVRSPGRRNSAATARPQH